MKKELEANYKNAKSEIATRRNPLYTVAKDQRRNDMPRKKKQELCDHCQENPVYGERVFGLIRLCDDCRWLAKIGLKKITFGYDPKKCALCEADGVPLDHLGVCDDCNRAEYMRRFRAEYMRRFYPPQREDTGEMTVGEEAALRLEIMMAAQHSDLLDPGYIDREMEKIRRA